MSLSRTIRRRIAREGNRMREFDGRVPCPNCGAKLTRSSMLGKKVKCARCQWEGRLK